ncbi:hypothetical protein caldi_28510 [Caldinitratiruptor microaerophilus]|uniref:VWA domain-containing protein n=1 Tax=Caldinitratiruptor microaerophilus TaxID=671077 RepID=A0AA35G958_9FIRM|nr:hypothetical protein caldi_28510 [Caldinitratiruptor microaerophilus]
MIAAWPGRIAASWARLRELLALLALYLGSALRLLRFLLRPADPNNLFLVAAPGRPSAGAAAADATGRTAGPGGGESPHADSPHGAAHRAVPGERTLVPMSVGTRRRTLLWAGPGHARADRPAAAPGSRASPGSRVETVVQEVNRRFSLQEVLEQELRRLRPLQAEELPRLVERLARRWLSPGETFRPVERRTRLDVQETLRRNIPRYGGHVLTFYWARRELPVPRRVHPARVLVIGDVSHSMHRYTSVALYFFHLLGFWFDVDSYVFSEHATRATPFLRRAGTFEERVSALARAATSWNAGTRLGTSLEEIRAQATVDPHTHVVIATDGKVSLGRGEYEKIETQMAWLRARAREIVIMTPDPALGARGRASRAATGPPRAAQAPLRAVGSLRSGLIELPIYDLGEVWQTVVGRYAGRIYHVRTVQDLVDMCEDLYRSTAAPAEV